MHEVGPNAGKSFFVGTTLVWSNVSWRGRRAQGHPLDLRSCSIVIGGMQRRISSLHVLVNGHVVLVPVR